jgi:hypothetical protein
MEPVMNLAFRAVASLGVALTAVALPLAFALPAQASTPGWRVVFGTH